MVRARGFEPPTYGTQSHRATKLRYAHHFRTYVTGVGSPDCRAQSPGTDSLFHSRPVRALGMGG